MILINSDFTESLPTVTAEYPAISRPSPKYNSTNLKNYVSQET